MGPFLSSLPTLFSLVVAGLGDFGVSVIGVVVFESNKKSSEKKETN